MRINGGSGTCIGYDAGTQSALILSAAHVFEETAPIRVVFPDGQAFDGKLLGRHRTADVALVTITSANPLPFAQVGGTAPAPGETLWKIGYAGGTRGILAGLLKQHQRGENYLVSIPFRPGDSGGGVFNIRSEVVGVVCGYVKQQPSLGIAADLIAVQALVQQVNWPHCLKRQPPAPPAAPSPSPTPTPTPKAACPCPPPQPGPPGPAGPAGPPGQAANTQELAALRQRLDELEKRLAGLSGSVRIQVQPKTK